MADTLTLAQAGVKQYPDVELDQYERSSVFKIYRFGRPWYRSFHFSWLSFFVAFTGWFAFIPALDYIKEDPNLDITADDVKSSNIFAVLGTIFIRFALGPLCERFGPKRCQTAILLFGAFVVYLSATVKTAQGLIAVRFFIGLIGGSFVPCQYWMTMMFAGNTVGTANAVAGGWGNLGGGFANIFVGGIIKLLRENAGVADDVAWRIAFVFPATLLVLVAVPMAMFGDDCPQGKWSNRLYNNKKNDDLFETDSESEKAGEEYTKSSEFPTSQYSTKDESLPPVSKFAGFDDYRVWIMAIQYACCFGVELTINGSMANYLYTEFTEEGCIENTTTEVVECSILGKDNASIIAGCFGLMNLFARALGGLSSDRLNKMWGIRGRLAAQFIALLGEGIMLLIFSRIEELGAAIFMLLMFSVFVQASEGTTFSLTPFVVARAVGQVSGIVGAGGNIGAVSWNTMIKQLDSTREAYYVLGWIVLASSLLTAAYPIQGVYLLFGSSASEKAVDEESPESVEKAADQQAVVLS